MWLLTFVTLALLELIQVSRVGLVLWEELIVIVFMHKKLGLLNLLTWLLHHRCLVWLVLLLLSVVFIQILHSEKFTSKLVDKIIYQLLNSCIQ